MKNKPDDQDFEIPAKGTLCSECQQKAASLNCVSCVVDGKATPLCKSCAQFVSVEMFALCPEWTKELQPGAHCATCYETKIQAKLAEYTDIEQRAKEVAIYDSNQGKETRLMRRTEKPVKVENCNDEPEVLMRLAFLAAEKKFNAVLDVAVKGVKVRTGGYQTTIYSGTGVPANINDRQILKDRALWQNPN